MNTNLVIIPTRGRPKNAERALKHILENSEISDVIFGLDEDDEHNYPRLEGARYVVRKRMQMNKTFNLIARENAKKYKTITFQGDDNVIRTKGWDTIIYQSIKDRGYGISYGNDILRGESLPTAVMMSTNIISTLGYMAPPKLIHLMMDCFWQDLGRELNCIDYYDDVIMEHVHYGAHEGLWDQTYAEAINDRVVTHDKMAYEDYLKNDFALDVEKIKRKLVLLNG